MADTHPTWTAEEHELAEQLHTENCGCDRPVSWGWLRLARENLMMTHHLTRLARLHEPHLDPEV